MKKKGKDSTGYNYTWKCRLRVFRAEHEHTQEYVADKLGVTRQTISGIEKGRYNPSLLLAYMIANMYGVTIEEMFVFSKKEK